MIEIHAAPLAEEPPHSASVLPIIQSMTCADLGDALRAGVRDFRDAPRFGIFFSAVYVLGGFNMIWLGAGIVI